MFSSHNLNFQFAEEYYSVSSRRVLRGLHFQLPPHDYAKLVYCVTGEVYDVLVDLRMGSPMYGKYQSFILNDSKRNTLYLPKGIAHGFCVLSESAVMVYSVSANYSEQHDAGICWDSFDIPWPEKNPILSERDKKFVLFKEFQSPFKYQQARNE